MSVKLTPASAYAGGRSLTRLRECLTRVSMPNYRSESIERYFIYLLANQSGFGGDFIGVISRFARNDFSIPT